VKVEKSREAARSSAKPPTSATPRTSPSERDTQPTSASPPTSATPQPLRGLAAWRETNNAATATALSNSRSPPTPRTSRAKPQSRKELGEDPHVSDTQNVALGAGHPAHLRVAAHVSDTPTSSRLGGLARDKQRRDGHRPLEQPIAADTRTGRAKPQSRKELGEDPHVSDTQTVSPLWRDALPTSASRRSLTEPADLFVAWRLGAPTPRPEPKKPRWRTSEA
jgi:hypothetical protein